MGTSNYDESGSDIMTHNSTSIKSHEEEDNSDYVERGRYDAPIDTIIGANEEYNGISCTNSSICRRMFPTGFWSEYKSTLHLSWGLVLSQICISAMQPLATMFGGHLGKTELDAIGLANTLINISGSSIAIGMATACTTLFAQTYGSNNKKLLGLQLQRGLIIVGLTMLPCIALHLNMETILLLMGQNPDVARLTGEYLLMFIPGLCGMFTYVVLRLYLQCQNIILPMVMIGLISTGFNALFQYLFLYQLHLGVRGSALAQGLAYVIMAAISILYIICTKLYKDTWDGFSWKCLNDWGTIAKLGVLGLLMTCFEWWAFEISVILAGILGTTELAAQTIMFNLDVFPLSVAIGLGTATAIRVGHALGAGRPLLAKTSARVGIFVCCSASIVGVVLYFTLRFELPKIFTSLPEVVELAASLLPFVASYNFFTYLAAVSRGILRGCGKQMIGTVVAFICYYIIALPVGIPLMFASSLRSKGVWIGLICGLVFSTGTYFIYIVFLANWTELSRQARIRAGVLKKEQLLKTSENEKTPLLNGKCGTSRPLADISPRRYSEPVHEDEPSRGLILQRLFVTSIFIAIFVVGLLCRYFVKPPTAAPSIDDSGNQTSTDNSTYTHIMSFHIAVP